MPWLKIIFLSRLFELLPWAHKLAVITAKHPVTHQRSQLLRNTTFELDGEITDATSGIQFVWPNECVRRTHIHTGRTAPAMILLEGGIHRQRCASEYFAKKKERPSLGMNQHVVLANPAQARPLRQRSL